jgi:hypothetical protein
MDGWWGRRNSGEATRCDEKADYTTESPPEQTTTARRGDATGGGVGTAAWGRGAPVGGAGTVAKGRATTNGGRATSARGGGTSRAGGGTGRHGRRNGTTATCYGAKGRGGDGRGSWNSGELTRRIEKAGRTAAQSTRNGKQGGCTMWTTELKGPQRQGFPARARPGFHPRGGRNARRDYLQHRRDPLQRQSGWVHQGEGRDNTAGARQHDLPGISLDESTNSFQPAVARRAKGVLFGQVAKYLLTQ